MNYRYIAIEGNIGSGKTTLATLLADHYNGLLVLEEFRNNPFLEHFYKEPERYAFPLELSFLADRYQQLKTLLPQQNLFAKVIISDYIFPKTKIFARNNLNESEYQLFERIADLLKVELYKPDLLIYLYTPLQQLQANIRKRGRSYEQDIRDEYLLNIEAAYQSYLRTETINTLVVDTTGTDIRDKGILARLIGIIESKDRPPGKLVTLST